MHCYEICKFPQIWGKSLKVYPSGLLSKVILRHFSLCELKCEITDKKLRPENTNVTYKISNVLGLVVQPTLQFLKLKAHFNVTIKVGRRPLTFFNIDSLRFSLDLGKF